MQTWVETEIFPRLIASGMKKFAVILPADILKQMALEQTMEEEKSGAFQSQYFSNMEDAKKWALKV